MLSLRDADITGIAEEAKFSDWQKQEAEWEADRAAWEVYTNDKSINPMLNNEAKIEALKKLLSRAHCIPAILERYA